MEVKKNCKEVEGRGGRLRGYNVRGELGRWVERKSDGVGKSGRG